MDRLKDRTSPLASGQTTPRPGNPAPSSSAGPGDSLRIEIPLPPAVRASPSAGSTPPVPRMAAEPTLNATAPTPPPAFPPAIVVPSPQPPSSPPQSQSQSQAKLGRSGTVKSAKPQLPPHRRPSDGGYDGGVERHGQANDFVDEPDDDTDSDGGAGAFKGQFIRTPHPSRRGGAGGPGGGSDRNVKQRDFSLDDDYDWGGSIRKNRNPSMSSHQHKRLPQSRRGSMNFGSGIKPLQRSSSVSSIHSMRSVEAGLHPFPTPGQKFNTNTGEFDDWKSTEELRLEEDDKKLKHWKRWGPYVSERQWATVREDYSGNGDAWTHFPHDQARSRAYRWGEDGLGGISDNHGKIAFTVGLWNEKDPILKERLFGVTGHQGNHGEDVKEMYYYLDSTPTHSYMKFLYKYPQREYPYEQFVRENGNRDRTVNEFEITDTNLFDDNKYWDVFVEYAKDEDNAEGISIRITAYNRGPEPATLHIIPQLLFRNIWSWPKEAPKGKAMPSLHQVDEGVVQIDEEHLGRYYLHATSSPAPVDPLRQNFDDDDGEDALLVDEVVVPELLFTENNTNFERLYNGRNVSPYVKDAFHDHIIHSHRPPLPKVKIEKPAKEKKEATAKKPEVVESSSSETEDDAASSVNGSSSNGTVSASEEDDYDSDATAGSNSSTATEYATPVDTREFVNPEKKGTKVGAHYVFRDVPANGGCAVVRVKLTTKTAEEDPTIQDEEEFDMVIEERRTDADEFYSRFNSGALTDDMRNIMRQALSGMLWSKQFYMFIQKEWIEGDPGQPAPPPERKYVRNRDWKHMHIEDVLSMPDKWEYPFFAIWDSAFHCIPLAMVDPAFAKKQLDIMTREWYMKPDGALPAYEWNFSDVNPPVHAWATFRVFKIERKMHGKEDLHFLERVFQKLLLNFTWWVNRKDEGGNNVFEGGFLGLDNISAFNRSEELPTGGTMRQADGTGWMGFYSLTMLNIALELAKHNPVYEDIASKFFEHFLFISDALTFHDGDGEVSLWSDEEGFYFDAITWGPGAVKQIPIRSLVGLIPLYATLTLEPSTIKKFPGFKKRMEWFIQNRTTISKRNIANMSLGGKGDRRLLALASEDRLRRILERMLDEEEFLSDYGIRSLSRYHKDHPWSMNVNGEEFSVGYWPGDSMSGMFGGNSNWRGPIWLATTFLLIESLQRFYQYHGSKFKVECPTGSGDEMNLANVADEIQHRVIHIFARDHEGNRACNGGSELLNKDPHFRDYVLFHEFFHGDTGKGLGASHQTGWTGLVAYFIWQVGSSARLPRTPRTPRSAAAHYFDDIPPTPGGSEYEFSDAPIWGEMSCAELSPDDL